MKQLAETQVRLITWFWIPLCTLLLINDLLFASGTRWNLVLTVIQAVILLGFILMRRAWKRRIT